MITRNSRISIQRDRVLFRLSLAAAGMAAIGVGLGWASETRAALAGFGTNNSGPVYPSGQTTGNIAQSNGTVTLNFNANGDNPTPTGVPNVNNGALTLTTTDGNEQSSAWFNNAQLLISPWTATFQYVTPSGAGADGFYFGVQNTSAGVNLLNGNGSQKGFTTGGTASAKSFGVGVETYNQSNFQVAYQTSGSTGNESQTTVSATSPVNFRAANSPVDVTVSYDGGTTVSFQAKQGTNSFSQTVNLPESIGSILGGPMGYVGFTGGTGGSSESQTISNFSFSSASLVPVAINGYNQDLIVPNSATLNGNGQSGYAGYVSKQSFDSDGNYFYQAGLSGAPTGTGLPASGMFTNDSITYQLGPTVGTGTTVSNALLLNSSTTSGTLTLSQMGKFNAIALLAASANANSNSIGSVTLNFVGPTGQAITATTDYGAPDWFQHGTGTTPDGNSYWVALQGFNRVSGNGTFDTAYQSNNPELYTTYLNLADLNAMLNGSSSVTDGLNLSGDTLESLTFNGTASGAGSTGIFAISGYAVPAPASGECLFFGIVGLGVISLLPGRRRAKEILRS